MIRLSRGTVLVLAYLFLLSRFANSQIVDTDVELGLKPYGAYHGGALDTISMTNGNLVVHIPLFSYPQRGNLKFGYSLIYNAKHYTNRTTCNSMGDCTVYSVLISSVINPVGVVAAPDFIYGDDETIVQPTKGTPPVMDLYDIRDAFGARHPLAQLANGSYESVDATAFNFNAGSSPVIIDPDGVHNSVEDPNGNELTTNSSNQQVDSLGRVPVTSTTTSDYTGCSGTPAISSALILTRLAPSGSTANYKECFTTISVVTSFDVTDGTTVSGSRSVLQSVVLPDQTTWTFTYTTDGFADLSTITLPTGGTIAYTWTTNFSSCSNQNIATPAILTRTINANDGNGNQVWKYAVPGVATGSVPPHLTDPLGNDTVYTFVKLGSKTCALYPSVVSSYQGSYSSGTLMKAVTTTYSYYDTGSAGDNGYLSMLSPAVNVVPSSVTTQWANGQTQEVVKTYDTNFTFKDPASTSSETFSGSYGKVLTSSEYDYGSNQVGGLLRKTVTDYLAFDNTNYLANNLLTQPSSISTYNGSGGLLAQTTYGYDETSLQSSGVTTAHTSPPNGTYRGNQTSEKRLLSGTAIATSHCSPVVSNGFLVNTTTYFDTGMEYQSVDSCQQTTTYSYSGTYAGAYRTQTSNPLNQVELAAYDFNTGLTTSTTDRNNQTTSYTYDSMGRTTAVVYPNTYQGTSGQTAFQYNALASPANVVITKTASPSPQIQEEVDVDGVGREAVTKLLTDPAGVAYTRTSYDGLGRKYQVWNPTRCNPVTSTSCSSETTWGITTYSYDALGRPLTITEPDNTTKRWLYTGNTTTVTDESSNQWQQTKDALGRLTKVMEPNGASATPSMETDYSYDALNNLISATQWGGPSGTSGVRTRSFSYDSLSRLLQAYNPEAGWLCYGKTGGIAPNGSNCTSAYDANGNTTARTDARGSQTTYAYDALGRLTDKTYSDSTPGAHFNYDETSVTVGTSSNSHAGPYTISNGIGRLTSQYAGMSAPGVGLAVRSFSYDPIGRVIQSAECWGPQECASTYGTRASAWGYDLAGGRISSDNSASRTFSYTYNAAGQLLTEANSAIGVTTPMVTNMTYFPTGQPQVMTTAGSSATITGTWGIDKRLRVTSYTNLSTANAGNTNYGYSLNYTLNSNVQGSTETAYNPAGGSQTWAWTNQYDTLNRLVNSASTGIINYSCGETYDAWGNRTNQAPTGTQGASCTSTSTPSTALNQLSGYSYDAAGHLLYDGSNTITYDAEGRIATLTPNNQPTTSYVYGADGQRAGKIINGSETNYVRDLDGSLLATYVGGTYNNLPQELWVQGRHFGTANVNSNGAQTITLSLTNWLGSEAVRTNASTGIPSSAYLSEPFGDGLLTLFGSNSDDIHFTSKERDSEAGLDYFGARYYGSTMGRWVSPDWAEKPENIPYADLTNPQSLNLYSYVRNNPWSSSDASGHETENSGGPAGGIESSVDPNEGRVQRPRLLASETGSARKQRSCRADACVTATTHWWSRTFAAAGVAFTRFGRLGGPAHRGAIDRISRLLQDDGYSVTPEKFIPTPNGSKPYRFADVYAENKSTGEVRMYQVGRTNANGTPVAREVRALDDIEGATEMRPQFIDYNSPVATGEFAPVPMIEPMPEEIPIDIP